MWRNTLTRSWTPPATSGEEREEEGRGRVSQSALLRDTHQALALGFRWTTVMCSLDGGAAAANDALYDRVFLALMLLHVCLWSVWAAAPNQLAPGLCLQQMHLLTCTLYVLSCGPTMPATFACTADKNLYGNLLSSKRPSSMQPNTKAARSAEACQVFQVTHSRADEEAGKSMCFLKPPHMIMRSAQVTHA